MAALTLSAPDVRAAKRLVVKIGSALLVDRRTGLKQNWLSALALDVAEAKTRGTDVVLVSSGSIALGRKVLGLPEGVLTLEQSQAAAAVDAWLSHFGVAPAATAKEREVRTREALQWALGRGSRSGRAAWQFAKNHAGAQALKARRA